MDFGLLYIPFIIHFQMCKKKNVAWMEGFFFKRSHFDALFGAIKFNVSVKACVWLRGICLFKRYDEYGLFV